MNIRALRNEFIRRLRDIYNDREAENIFFRVSEKLWSISRMDFFRDEEKQLSAGEQEKLQSVLARLVAHEPLQYILKETEFYGLPLKLNSHTLIPRPETEELVDLVRNEVKKPPGYILDIGTGSGCIALSMAKLYPDAVVDALDVSYEALAVTEENAARNQLKINTVRADLLQNAFHPAHMYDLIISNPPYIREEEKTDMHQTVLDYEPHRALFVSNNDPLIFYKSIYAFAESYLAPQGYLFLEINQYLGEETLEVYTRMGWSGRLFRDMSGNDRFIAVWK